MRQLFFLFLILLPVLASSQMNEDVYFESSKTKRYHEIQVDNVDVNRIAAKQIHIQQCLLRYKSQKETGMVVSIAGAGVAVMGAYEDKNAITYVGAGLSLIGILFQLDANKWLRRTSIEPVEDGAVFIFKF